MDLLLIVMVILLAMALGAVMGSFCTAWIWRTYQGKSMLEKHSICPHCRHDLGWIDLIPLFSYAVQKGRCRYCHKSISWQYPAIELATALLFTISAWWLWATGIVAATPFWWLLIAIILSWVAIVLLVCLFVFDARWGLLPDIWTLGGSAMLLVVTVVATALHQPLLWQPTSGCGLWVMGCGNYTLQPTTYTLHPLLATLASSLIAALFFSLIIIASEKILKKPGMGWGDAKLALFLGLLLGFPGIVVALYLAFIFGAVLSLGLIAGKQKRFGQSIPFGPFMIAGAVASYILTPIMVTWYYQLL